MATKRKQQISQRKKVIFHYMKGPDFRTIHCDGAVGGLTPRGLIHMAVFSERHAIPKRTAQELTDSDTLGAELAEERDVLDGVVRQMEVDLFLGEDTARGLRDWLNGVLSQLEVLKAGQAKAATSPTSSGNGRTTKEH